MGKTAMFKLASRLDRIGQVDLADAMDSAMSKMAAIPQQRGGPEDWYTYSDWQKNAIWQPVGNGRYQDQNTGYYAYYDPNARLWKTEIPDVKDNEVAQRRIQQGKAQGMGIAGVSAAAGLGIGIPTAMQEQQLTHAWNVAKKTGNWKKAADVLRAVKKNPILRQYFFMGHNTTVDQALAKAESLAQTSGRSMGEAATEQTAANAGRLRNFGRTMKSLPSRAWQGIKNTVSRGGQSAVEGATSSAGSAVRGTSRAGRLMGSVGRGASWVGRRMPYVMGAYELAREVPAGEMASAYRNRNQAQQAVSNLSPERAVWMRQNASGVFQQANPNDAFGGGGGWAGTYADYYGGENAYQNIAKVARAPMNVASYGLYDLFGGNRALNQWAKQTDQARQQTQQGQANLQRMRQQYQQQQNRNQHAQATWTPQQLTQHIRQKQQQVAQLQGNPQAAGRVAQLQNEIRWLRQQFQA